MSVNSVAILIRFYSRKYNVRVARRLRQGLRKSEGRSGRYAEGRSNVGMAESWENKYFTENFDIGRGEKYLERQLGYIGLCEAALDEQSTSPFPSICLGLLIRKLIGRRYLRTQLLPRLGHISNIFVRYLLREKRINFYCRLIRILDGKIGARQQ